MNPFLVRAQSILNSIRNAIGGIASQVRGKIAGNVSNLPRGLDRSMLASMGSATRQAMAKGKPTGNILAPGHYLESYRSPVTGKMVNQIGGENAAGLSPSTQSSISNTAGAVSTPSPKATRGATVVNKRFINPTRHGPSLADIQAGVRRVQAQMPGIRKGVSGLERTQAPTPSSTRRAAGVTPPSPTSRVESNKPSSTPAVEAPAIRSYRSGGSVPTAPRTERVPLLRKPKKVRATVSKSTILRELKRARGNKPGYVLLPEERALEARPRKRAIANI